jgi:hypothetical protein
MLRLLEETMQKSNSRKSNSQVAGKPGKSNVVVRPAIRTSSASRRAALAIEREMELQDPERWDGMG